MSGEPEEFSQRHLRRLTVLVLIAIVAVIALANLSSEAVTGDLIKRIANGPERAYGWPMRWYWRIAETVPGRIKPQPGLAPRSLLQWPVARFSARNLIADLAIWLAVLAGAAAASQRLLRRYQLRLRWRPRMTTFVVLLAIAAPIVLGNMSFEVSLLALPSIGHPFFSAILCSGRNP